MALKSTKKTTAKKTTTPAETKKKSTTTGAAPASKSWYTEGEEGFDKKAKNDHLAQMRREKGVPRFYLKHKAVVNPETGAKSNEARVVFLDSKPFFMYEHRIAPGGRWEDTVYLTCTRDFGPCSICESLGDRPTFTAYLTVIDTRKWPKKTPDKKTGSMISEPRRMLFPAKGVAIDKIKEILEENKKDLRGLVVDIKRLGDKDPNCGRDFSVKGRLTEAKLRDKFEAETLQPFAYRTVLAPPTPEELQAAGVHVSVVAGSDEDLAQDSVNEDGEDDVKGLLDD